MKIQNVFLLLLLLTFAVTANAQYNTVGKWQLIEDGDTGLFIFDAEGYMSMERHGEVTGGKRYEYDDYDACTQYITTPTKDAAIFKLDIIIRILDEDSTVVFMGLGLIKFLNNNCMLFALDFEHGEEGDLPTEKKEALRPKDFSNKKNVGTLNRIK